jgi:hypothetical protein
MKSESLVTFVSSLHLACTLSVSQLLVKYIPF